MVANVIEIDGLRKEYRRRGGRSVAIDGLDLSVPEGGVFGFLGPNGSGKTTTIRCLLGLARPTRGSVRLLGRPVPDGLAEAVRRVGAIVESPALFPTMSGRDNLMLLGAIDRIGPRRVDTVLEEVGLAERGGDQVRKYSLGMRQRLALGAALLKNPALLILDEPANGLDPAGIRGVRRLLRRLADQGRTVFVSSHLLAEIEQTCDRVAILRRGRCVTQGTVAEVVSAAGHAETMLVSVDDLEAARAVLEREGVRVEEVEGKLRVEITPCDAALISRTLGEQGLWVRELRPDTHSLEDLFLEMTGDDDTAELEEVSA
ncbi:MAG TPA: ABC transporter ATP-binding protein [Acidimicrobiia bacterium]|nr:ABC transporter ATP-binding protein [Acidimicrobiia bacterium]